MRRNALKMAIKITPSRLKSGSFVASCEDALCLDARTFRLWKRLTSHAHV